MARKFSNTGSGRAQRPPVGKPWVWFTRELLDSEAWNGMGINTRRVIDFLLCEHMAHGGRENGNLKAPYRQLVQRGIGQRHVANAIRAAEVSGLIIARRGGMRVATTYTLAWLPLPDGTMPHAAWKNQESASPSAGGAASPSGARRPQSVSRREGRQGRPAASPSDRPLKNSNHDGSLSIGSRYGEEARSEEWDE